MDNVEQMRAYLRSKGFDVKPGNGGKTRTGDYAFEIKDPDGTLVEFVQSLPDGNRDAGCRQVYAATTRIHRRSITWVFWSGTLDKSLAFYEDVLGFKETWRGGREPKELSWINLRVPDGNGLHRVDALQQTARHASAPRTTLACGPRYAEGGCGDLEARPGV